MQIVPGGVVEQTEQALKNLKAVVEAGGSELGKVAKTTVRVLGLHIGLGGCGLTTGGRAGVPQVDG